MAGSAKPSRIMKKEKIKKMRNLINKIILESTGMDKGAIVPLYGIASG